nr:hypothetical protein [Tanacetum cinerariifolium]
MQTQEDHSNPIRALNVDSLKVDSVVIQNPCLETEDSNSETASSKSVKEKDLKGTRIEHGFKRAFMSLFGQDADTFTSTMLLNVDHLQKQLDKDEFQEDGSMTAFRDVNNQFQKFIDSQVTLDYDSQMTEKYFVEYTGIEVKHFRDTLLQHMENVKKFVLERARHQRKYARRVNKRLMQMQESNIDMGKAVNDDLVVPKSSETESEVQDVNSSSNDMVHNHYLDEAKKNTQERDRNSKPSEMTLARFQSATADSKPKPMSTNHSSKSLPMSKSSCVTMPAMPKADHSKSPSSFSDHTCRIFKSVGLGWLSTGKLFDSCINKVESEPPHGSNIDISKIHECKQTLDLSAGTSINVLKEQNLYASVGILWNVTKYNLRTMASDQLSSDPAPECQTMASDQNSSDPAPECQTMASDQNNSDPAHECQRIALNHDSLSLVIQRQGKVTQADRTVTTSNELDLLFSLMFDELLNGSSKVVSKSSVVSAADAPNQRQQLTTPLNNHTTPAPTCQIPSLTPTAISSENINQAETYAKNDQVADDEFINIFSTRYKTKGRRRHVMLIR